MKWRFGQCCCSEGLPASGYFDYYGWWPQANLGYPYDANYYRRGYIELQSNGLYRAPTVLPIQLEVTGTDGGAPTVPYTSHRQEWMLPVNTGDITKEIATTLITSSPMGLTRDPNRCQEVPPMPRNPSVYDEFCWMVRGNNYDHPETDWGSELISETDKIETWGKTTGYAVDAALNKLYITGAYTVDLSVNCLSGLVSVTPGAYLLDIVAEPFTPECGLIVTINNTNAGTDFVGCELDYGTVAKYDGISSFSPAIIITTGQKYLYRHAFAAASAGSALIKIGLSEDAVNWDSTYDGVSGDGAFIHDISVKRIINTSLGNDVVLFDCITGLKSQTFLNTGTTVDGAEIVDWFDSFTPVSHLTSEVSAIAHPSRIGPVPTYSLASPDNALGFPAYRSNLIEYEFDMDLETFVPIATGYDGVETSLCTMMYPDNTLDGLFCANENGLLMYNVFDGQDFQVAVEITKDGGKTFMWSVVGDLPGQSEAPGLGISALFHPAGHVLDDDYTMWPNICDASYRFLLKKNTYMAGSTQSFLHAASPHGYPNVWGLKMNPFYGEPWVEPPYDATDYFTYPRGSLFCYTYPVETTDYFAITRGPISYQEDVEWGTSPITEDVDWYASQEKDCATEEITDNALGGTTAYRNTISPILSASTDEWWTSESVTNERIMFQHIFWMEGPTYKYPEILQKNIWGRILYHDDDGDLAICIIQDSKVSTELHTYYQSEGSTNPNPAGGSSSCGNITLSGYNPILDQTEQINIIPAETVRDEHHIRVLFGSSIGSELTGMRIYGPSDLGWSPDPMMPTPEYPVFCGPMIVQPSERYSGGCMESVRAIYFSAVYANGDEPKAGTLPGREYRGTPGYPDHYRMHAIDANGSGLWTLEAISGYNSQPYGIQSTDRHIFIANFPMCDTRTSSIEHPFNTPEYDSVAFDWAISHDGQIKWPIRTDAHPAYDRATERHPSVALPGLSFDCVKNSSLLRDTPVRHQWLDTNEKWHSFFRYNLVDDVTPVASPSWAAIDNTINGGGTEATVSYNDPRVEALETGFVGFLAYPMYYTSRNRYKTEIIGKTGELDTVLFNWPAFSGSSDLNVWLSFTGLNAIYADAFTTNALYDYTSEYINEAEKIIKYTFQFGRQNEGANTFNLRLVTNPEEQYYTGGIGSGLDIYSCVLYKTCYDCHCDPTDNVWETDLSSNLVNNNWAL